jgi:long-chain acyl-CoA synthetase
VVAARWSLAAEEDGRQPGEIRSARRARATRRRWQVQVPVDDLHLSFEQLLANDGTYQVHAIADLRQVNVVLQYTGGTTGLPKGAMLTHANLSAACAQYVESARGDPSILAEGEERVLVVLPLFHIYSLTVNLLLGMRRARCWCCTRASTWTR